jgi:ubiquinone/menaquinone biosynthesis C-methylase UbiE
LPVLGQIRKSEVILDVGCGRPGWSWIRLVGRRRLDAGVGIDRSWSSLTGESTDIRWGSYLLATGSALPIGDKAVDTVIALDFIEHLSKAEGALALDEFLRVARDEVVVVTPNGFLPQSADENPWQEHLSGWTIEELEAKGFAVTGIRGMKLLRGAHGSPTVRPQPLGLLLSLLTSPIARVAPSLAFQLMAVWRSRLSK